MSTTVLPFSTYRLSQPLNPQCRKRSYILSVPPPPPLLTSRGPKLLQRNGVLARAEDKARGGGGNSSSIQQQLPKPNSDMQLQELTPSGTCDPLCSVDETSSLEYEATYQPKTDLLKALAIFGAAVTGAVAINHSWVAENQDLAMALLFGIGYAGIIFEESLAFNKSGVGLLMAVSLWVIRSIGVRRELPQFVFDFFGLNACNRNKLFTSYMILATNFAK